MKAAISIKVAFGILALYMSIPLSIVAAQHLVAQSEASAASASVAMAR